MLHLEEEGEEGMVHSLLSSLPDIADDALDEEESVADKLPTLDQEATNDLDNEELLQTAPDRDLDPILDHGKADSEGHERPASDHEQPLEPDKVFLQQDYSENEVHSARPSPKVSEISPEHGKTGFASEQHLLNKVEDPEIPAGDAISIIPSITTVKLEDDDEMLPTCSVCPKLTRLFLTDLLKHADTLYSTFPPSHPGLSLSSIMGPQSVVFTWSESPSSLPSDNTAEAMVSHPELVVYPFIETQMESKESEEKTRKKARRKRHKLRRSPFGHIEGKTMVAGTVIVLGVAMAIYGVKTGDGSGHSIFHNFAESHGHANAKDWTRLVTGAVVGVTTKIINGLSSANS